MAEKDMACFKASCEGYLSGLGLNALRSYGRHLQLRNPTALKKSDLIKEIVKALCGETFPQRNKKGAPIKNNCVISEILEKVSSLQAQYLCFEKEDDNAAVADNAAVEEKPISVNATEEETLKQSVCLQFKVCPSELTEKQKQLLNDFLMSL